MVQTALEFLRDSVPPSMQGAVWNALLAALATAEQAQWDNAPVVRDALFLGTATGTYLDKRAADLGIGRPTDIGLSDDQFRKLATIIASEKLSVVALEMVLEVLYGFQATHARVQTTTTSFDLSAGGSLVLTFDGRDVVEVPIVTIDYSQPTAATPSEVAQAISRVCAHQGLRHFATTDYRLGLDGQFLTIYSGSLGLRGSVQVASGSIQAVLGLPTTRATIVDLAFPAYVAGGTVVMPALSEIVRRQENEAAYMSEGPVEGTDTSLPGPYLYDDSTFAISAVSTTTIQTWARGGTYDRLYVQDATAFPKYGEVVVGLGYGYQVGPLSYEAVSSQELRLAKPVSFKFDVIAGANVNVVLPPRQFDESRTASAWVTPSASARVAASLYASELAAGGSSLSQHIVYPGGAGLGAEAAPTHGAQKLSDLVSVYAGDNPLVDLIRSRED